MGIIKNVVIINSSDIPESTQRGPMIENAHQMRIIF
jgi:hypothetical protein